MVCLMKSSVKFKQGINPNQEFLFPKKPADFLPDDHLAKAVYEIVGHLNLDSMIAKYSEMGQHAYDPGTMTRLLFYGYCIGVRSSRKISKGCEDRFDFIYLTDGLKPSHDRISDFRKDNLQELKDIFKDIVLIGANLGLANFGNIKVSIDGSKVKANASPKLTKDEEGLEKLMIKTEEEIKQLFEEAERIDQEENAKFGKNRGDELPKKLQAKESRLAAIKDAFELLKKQKQEAEERVKEEKKRELTKAELQKIEKMKINVTDRDARFMKERNGVIKPNYNAQVSVDEKNQFIIANDVTDECNDCHQLIPMMQETEKNIEEKPEQAKADNGYNSQLEKAVELFPETEFFVDDVNRRKKDLDMEKIKEEYSKTKLKNLKRLLTKQGSDEYKKRMYTVEPVIGNIKFNMGYRHFIMRGLKKVKCEFNLMCIAHNLKKIVSFVKKRGFDLAIALQNLPTANANGTRLPG